MSALLATAPAFDGKTPGVGAEAHLGGRRPCLGLERRPGRRASKDQLCTYEAGSPGSPDRLDAMVWAFTELMVDRNLTTGFLDYYEAMFRERFGGQVIIRGS